MKLRLILLVGVTCLFNLISTVLVAQSGGKKMETIKVRNQLPVVLVLNLGYSMQNRTEFLEAAKKALIPYSKKSIRLITSPFERPQAEAFFKQYLGIKSSDEVTANLDTLQYYLSRYYPRTRLNTNWNSFLLHPSESKYQLKEIEVAEER